MKSAAPAKTSRTRLAKRGGLLILLALLVPLAMHVRILWNDAGIVQALREGRMEDARGKMKSPHDLIKIIDQLAANPSGLQHALEVQFLYFYQDDSNLAYPENLAAVQRLTGLGVHPGYEHLLKAAEQGKMATVSYFLDLGVTVEEAGSPDTPLANVAYRGDSTVLARMIAAGADVNRPSSDGRTPLLAAAWSGQAECVKLLLAHGARIDFHSRYASWRGNEEQPLWRIVEDRAMTSSADPREVWAIIKDYKDRTDTDRAFDQVDRADVVVDYDWGTSLALHYAGREEHLDSEAALLSRLKELGGLHDLLVVILGKGHEWSDPAQTLGGFQEACKKTGFKQVVIQQSRGGCRPILRE